MLLSPKNSYLTPWPFLLKRLYFNQVFFAGNEASNGGHLGHSSIFKAEELNTNFPSRCLNPIEFLFCFEYY